MLNTLTESRFAAESRMGRARYEAMVAHNVHRGPHFCFIYFSLFLYESVGNVPSCSCLGFCLSINCRCADTSKVYRGLVRFARPSSITNLRKTIFVKLKISQHLDSVAYFYGVKPLVRSSWAFFSDRPVKLMLIITSAPQAALQPFSCSTSLVTGHRSHVFQTQVLLLPLNRFPPPALLPGPRFINDFTSR